LKNQFEEVGVRVGQVFNLSAWTRQVKNLPHIKKQNYKPMMHVGFK